MNFELQELYESVLITEMNQKVVDYLNKNADNLPFNHIFGDKKRVAFPIGTDITAQSIIDDISRIQHFDKVDLKKGEVVRKVKLDPKYGQGDYKEQRINMGKVISALKVSEEKKKKYLNWFALYKDNLESAFEKPEYIVVLSRAPIDVVRMSDHRNISSCHSQGGSYFHCAVQEVITGGAVAYVVTEEDFSELTEEEFQNKEIFADPDRNISGSYGLRPLARLRVRRLEDDNGDEVAIPDRKIYGNQSIPNFYDSLKNYLQNKQSATVGDFMEKGKYTTRGGSYYDEDIRSLLAGYFDNEKDTHYQSDFPKIKHDYDDESSERQHSAIGIEDELNAIKERYNNRMDYTEADFNIFDDEEVYYDSSGYSKIDISKFNLPDDVDLMVEDDYGVRDAINGNSDDDYLYSVLVQYLYDKADLGIYRIEMNNQLIEISFNDQEAHNDVDHFDTYCNYLERFDNNIDDMVDDEDELLEVFIEAGFIKEAPSGDPEYSMITQWLSDDDAWFDNFELLGTKPLKSFTVKAPTRILLNGARLDHRDYDMTTGVSSVVSKIIDNIANENFKPKLDQDDPAQMQFSKFFESYTNPLDGINYTPSIYITINYNNQLVTDNFQLIIPKMDNRNFQFVQFVDEFFPHILNALRLWCLDSIGRIDPQMFEALSKKHNYDNLKRVYSKYI